MLQSMSKNSFLSLPFSHRQASTSCSPQQGEGCTVRLTTVRFAPAMCCRRNTVSLRYFSSARMCTASRRGRCAKSGFFVFWAHSHTSGAFAPKQVVARCRRQSDSLKEADPGLLKHVRWFPFGQHSKNMLHAFPLRLAWRYKREERATVAARHFFQVAYTSC